MSQDNKDIGEAVVPPAPQPRIVDCTQGDLEPALATAKEVISEGRVMVMPTDTVYGICADAFDAYAVQRLLTAKRRGRDMPPPVLIGDEGVMAALAVDVPIGANRLVEAYWPGPLTIICKAQSSLRMDLGDTHGTIALRVPDNDLARAVLRRTGPLAVSSANVSGQPAATTVAEAADQLGLDVSLYLDGGPTPGPVPSTIVDFTAHPEGRVVREGVITLEQLREILPGLLAPVEPSQSSVEPPVADSGTAERTTAEPAQATAGDPSDTTGTSPVGEPAAEDRRTT
ncbi:L-threonylcarbamoyladenylate synthase [Raineyella fluvialis]|uniref:L-threonylcarbamoyladenylate synthase n=1 Tax=Raineyella fluvialis TaxID=2662261 RepID=A0A5Q2FHI1_9ACTN|nr:L-threonylcarbamoyladenylate synthase [Raineyella fluvialis]QGF25237.1 threonylcarbamoyl-AMP synthase [Raineyella fluvialis]